MEDQNEQHDKASKLAVILANNVVGDVFLEFEVFDENVNINFCYHVVGVASAEVCLFEDSFVDVIFEDYPVLGRGWGLRNCIFEDILSNKIFSSLLTVDGLVV